MTPVEALNDAARQNGGLWFESYSRIKMKSGAIGRPTMNAYQRDINEVHKYCRKHEIPCRIIGLKPRQKGSSTFFTNLMYTDVRRPAAGEAEVSACVMGGQYSQVDNLWQILNRYEAHDSFEWGNQMRITNLEGQCSNGGRIVKETAGDFDAARSGTFQWLLTTETARWRDEGVANAHKVLQGAMACVPDLPGTVVVLESTANGSSGAYFDFWQGAVTLEEFKAGKRGNGFVKVFRAWFEFPDSHLPMTEAQSQEIEETLTPDEKELIKHFGCEISQIAWRRNKIAGECGGDADLFEQEYPRSAETAFLLSGRKRFNRIGIEWQKRLLDQHQVERGTIELTKDGGVDKTSWRLTEDPGEAEFDRWEAPMPGKKYLIAVDTMTGASQAMGLDPDCHSVLCLRRGFYDAHGWHPTRVVARLFSPCRWDIDVLEHAVYRLAHYYGRCMIVPEINNDRGLIELLKLRRSAKIYRRRTTNKKTGKVTDAYGWQTNVQTRKNLEDAVAKAIREWDVEGEGIEVLCPNIIRELETFIVNEKGKGEAADGSHDDDVIALGIGLCTIDAASNYAEPVEEEFLAPDVKDDFKRRGRVNRNRNTQKAHYR